MNRRDFFSALGAAGVVGHLGRYTTHAQHLGDFKVDSPELQGSAHRAVWGRNGVVAAADQHASLAGVRMLMKGGNAIDAIVAAAAALNVAEPSMSGMGGFGGYMVVYLAAERKVVALDMMGLSSSAATADKFTEQDFDEGYKAPVVPGTIGGWAEALSRYGTMSLGDVFEPAIELAERGFVVTKYDALSFAAEANKLKKFPTTARIFFPDGKPPREGQVVKQPDLARSFRRIAIEGVDAFYHGELGEEIVAFLQENGGLLNKQDFASFQPRWREPIQTTFKGHTLYGMGPGSCEMTMFQVLNIMEGFDLESMTPYSSQFAHLWLEAVKLAFLDDDRYNTGKDVDIPVSRLISKEYASQQRSKIRPTNVSAFPGLPLPTVGTTSLSAADRWGNVVAFTQSLVSSFGSGVIAGNTGIFLNNGHRFGFTLERNHVNAVVGGAHPKGVMCPTIVMRGDRVLMGIGAAGGYTIPQTVGQSIVKVLLYGMDIQQAIASPRMLVNRGARVPVGNEAETYVEPGFPRNVADELKALGHRLTNPGNAGAVQGVYVDTESGTLAGASDPRRDGHPIAF
jgi:gamma-glutamyltranspeptidase / glutathione hydrolase